MLQVCGRATACEQVLPTLLQCATTSHRGAGELLRTAAQRSLVAIAEALPASVVHRCVLYPLLLQLRSGDHVANALVMVRCFS